MSTRDRLQRRVAPRRFVRYGCHLVKTIETAKSLPVEEHATSVSQQRRGSVKGKDAQRQLGKSRLGTPTHISQNKIKNKDRGKREK